MDAATASVIVIASICGAFCRAATGFSGSILFIMVYSVANQLHLAPGLESAVLMVLLGSVFEFSTSPVLFFAVRKEAAKLWRNLLLLSIPSLPGTLLGAFILVQTGENQNILNLVKLGLNCVFLLVAMFKISMECRTFARERRASRLLVAEDVVVVQEDDDKELCRKLGGQLLFVGFSCGFLNGLMGLPGPLIMVYFTHVLEHKMMTPSSSFTLTQAFFMITTILRLSSLTSLEVREEMECNWRLALLIPGPALLSLYGGWALRKCVDTAVLLQCVLWLLLLSSLMGLGVLAGSDVGLWALGVTAAWMGTLAAAVLCQTCLSGSRAPAPDGNREVRSSSGSRASSATPFLACNNLCTEGPPPSAECAGSRSGGGAASAV